ncbi:DMT family transporter [Candidatus Gottesmanbacteria bacterium]|nr:DMT family transporter [Candidatus Gottesmanbacteria bacterium]
MHWIVAGFLMFASSVITYLLVRAASLRHITGAMQNVAMFVIPLFVFIPLAFSSGAGLAVTGYQFALLLLSAVLFSYLGSRWSVISLQYAPNPGYSLILSKSYVVFTTIVAVVLFGSEITVRAATAIIFIVAFSALILIDKKKTQVAGVKSVWLLYALGAFICWGMLAIMSKYLLEIGVPIYTRLVYVIGIACVLFLRDSWSELKSLHTFTQIDWAIWVGMGVFSGAFNYFTQVGYLVAPNIGYINALNAASIAFVTIGASLLFHDEFSWRKFIGVVGVITGLILLVM